MSDQYSTSPGDRFPKPVGGQEEYPKCDVCRDFLSEKEIGLALDDDRQLCLDCRSFIEVKAVHDAIAKAERIEQRKELSE